MGISHLITHLRPYATEICHDHGTSTRRSDLFVNSETAMVIDGPGLAYHVYYTYLARQHRGAAAIGAALSHQDIGQAVIAWLDELQLCGLRVYDAIEHLSL